MGLTIVLKAPLEELKAKRGRDIVPKASGYQLKDGPWAREVAMPPSVDLN